MEERFSYLKTNFNLIIDLKESNISTMQLLDNRIKTIKDIYSEFISINREQLFIFTLDSFHFQSKLIDIEYEDMARIFHAITNRMYCDYYKLFKIIVEYVVENVPDKKLIELIKVNNNYPVYKDLEPFKQYDFQYIQSLHENVVVILVHLHGYISKKEHDLQMYQTKNKIGLNIDNFVNTFNFNTIIMKEKCNLFISYMEFFHVLHTKYFKRFNMKVQLMLNQINNDIKFDNPNQNEKTKHDIVKELKETNIDRDILRELKVSINHDTLSTLEESSNIETETDESSKPGTHESSSKGVYQTETDISNEYVSDLTDDKTPNTSPLLELENMFSSIQNNDLLYCTDNDIIIVDKTDETDDIQNEVHAVISDIIDNIHENTIIDNNIYSPQIQTIIQTNNHTK